METSAFLTILLSGFKGTADHPLLRQARSVSGNLQYHLKLCNMTILIIRFLNILMAELIAGTIFGIWIGYNSQNLSSPTYI